MAFAISRNCYIRKELWSQYVTYNLEHCLHGLVAVTVDGDADEAIGDVQRKLSDRVYLWSFRSSKGDFFLTESLWPIHYFVFANRLAFSIGISLICGCAFCVHRTQGQEVGWSKCDRRALKCYDKQPMGERVSGSRQRFRSLTKKHVSKPFPSGKHFDMQYGIYIYHKSSTCWTLCCQTREYTFWSCSSDTTPLLYQWNSSSNTTWVTM